MIPYPYKTPLPGSGQHAPADKALWCHIWDMSKGQYVPLGLARLDLAADRFTDFVAFPKEDAGLKPFTDAETTFFLPYTLKGKLASFDFKQRRWCEFLTVPRYGELFGFIGGPTTHKGKLYFSLSTYNGADIGCDGKPYHFCNALLEFDPRARRFGFPTLQAKDAYYQIAYTLSAGGEFFATGNNIRDPSGQTNRDRKGEVVFWQTIKPQKKSAKSPQR